MRRDIEEWCSLCWFRSRTLEGDCPERPCGTTIPTSASCPPTFATSAPSRKTLCSV
jgi:hypothetical protein